MSAKICSDFLTYAEAAIFLGIPVGSLYALVSRKRIPHVRLGRRYVRFSQPELTRFIEAHKVDVDTVGISSDRRRT